MKRLLWISGGLAAMAVLVPDLVVIGLYMGILPGVVLAVAPTFFLYAATIAGLRRALGLTPGKLANLASATLAIGLGVALGYPFSAAGRAAFEAAKLADVSTGQPVRLAGDVRLERSARVALNSPPRDGVWQCDALCAALLDTPEVTSVTLAGTDDAGVALAETTFRLVARADAPSAALSPKSPEQILAHLPREVQKGDFQAAHAKLEAEKNAVIAKWALRLASEKTLVAATAIGNSDLVILLQNVREAGFHRIAFENVEIRDAGGRALLRRHRVTAKPVGVPVHLVPEGPMLDQGFGIGRDFLHSGERYSSFEPIKTLFEESTLARPEAPEGGVADVRARIAEALAQPGQPGDLAMVASWIETLDWQKLEDADLDVLAQLIADTRVTALERIYDGYGKHVSPRLRTAIVKRLLDRSTSPGLRNRLNILVREMPKGTFAVRTSDEKALLADQELRLVSSAMIERLADSGAASVPLLVEILKVDARVDAWWKRQWVMQAVCRALTRLGPEAASALPAVEALVEAPRSLLMNDWGDAQDWRVALVRMGKPVEELSFPSHLGAESLARDRESVRKMAEKAGLEEGG